MKGARPAHLFLLRQHPYASRFFAPAKKRENLP
jgi:hypothetical protein